MNQIKFDIDAYDDGGAIVVDHTEREDGGYVLSSDYDDLKDVAQSMYDWCVYHGKLFSSDCKRILGEHGVE